MQRAAWALVFALLVLPKADRSRSVRQTYLRSLGYSYTPAGYEVDHIVPLSCGGSDTAENLQLLTVGEHRRKTSLEAREGCSPWLAPLLQVSPASDTRERF